MKLFILTMALSCWWGGCDGRFCKVFCSLYFLFLVHNKTKEVDNQQKISKACFGWKSVNNKKVPQCHQLCVLAPLSLEHKRKTLLAKASEFQFLLKDFEERKFQKRCKGYFILQIQQNLFIDRWGTIKVHDLHQMGRNILHDQPSNIKLKLS